MHTKVMVPRCCMRTTTQPTTDYRQKNLCHNLYLEPERALFHNDYDHEITLINDKLGSCPLLNETLKSRA